MATLNPKIKNINLGGISDSDYQGNEYTVSEAVGLDIHSEGGLIKVNQKLKDDNTGTGADKIDDNVILVATSGGGGYVWAFGTGSGRKVWKKSVSTGLWTYQGTVTSGFDSLISNVSYYKGYLYYAGELYLGRIAESDAWSARNDTWATMTAGIAIHPMKILNDVLYIGDGSGISQVDAGVFSTSALDIPSDLLVTTLGKDNTDLVIGTKGNYGTQSSCEIYKWNTWSDSWSYADTVPERAINAFLEVDNYIMVSAGTKGRIYQFDGYKLELYKRIKGSYASTDIVKVYDRAVLNFNGLAIFGFSNTNGTPTNMGIYSLGRTNKDTPFVLNMENLISTLNKTNVLITSICSYPDTDGNKYMVSWRSGASGSYTYGVDIIDTANKIATSYYTSKIMYVNRTAIDNYKIISVPYKNIPDGTEVKIYKKLNNAPTFTEITAKENDIKRQMIQASVVVGDGGVLQYKIELIANGNTAPEIEGSEISIN